MRLLQLLIVAGLSIFACAPAFAETGVGEAPRSALHDVRDAVSAPPLARIELDAFRFSQQPSLGGRGYVMTFAGRVEGAWAEIIWLDGHPRSGWRRTRRERFELSASEYRDIATFVDEQLARGEPQLIDDDGEGFVCTDGPGYLTERLMGGTQIWMRGFCGDDHPNQIIKNDLAVWALHRLGRRSLRRDRRHGVPRFPRLPSPHRTREPHMTTKFLTLALAAAFLLPGVLATLNQAALIVA